MSTLYRLLVVFGFAGFGVAFVAAFAIDTKNEGVVGWIALGGLGIAGLCALTAGIVWALDVSAHHGRRQMRPCSARPQTQLRPMRQTPPSP